MYRKDIDIDMMTDLDDSGIIPSSQEMMEDYYFDDEVEELNFDDLQ